MNPSSPPSPRKLLAEGFGTFLLVFLGCGAVHTAVLLGSQSGIWQVAIVWGLAIMLAIFCVDSISGAHLNPAMTVSFAFWGRHPWKHVLPYVASQLAGAILAASILFFLFQGFLVAKENEKQVTRGSEGSIVTAMCYGEYSPNPGSIATSQGPFRQADWDELRSKFGQGSAFIAEFLGTMILAMVVFAVTDSKNTARPGANLAPVFIGLTVSALISVLAPLTQAGFNPARDFGPRVFAYFAGWGKVALPGLDNSSWLLVYIVAPIMGAVAGGGAYRFLSFKDQG